MQFSYNSLDVLKEIKSPKESLRPSAFKNARKEIMKAFCYIDILDLDKFDKQLRTINKLKKQDRQLYLDDGLCIKPQKDKDKDNDDNFLKACTPQASSNKKIPSLLVSHYNSLILERAQGALKKKTDKTHNNKSTLALEKNECYKIFEFLEKYMEQCEDNRFDRLSLKETVLEYIEIWEPLIGKEDNFESEGPIIKTLNRLVTFKSWGKLFQSVFLGMADRCLSGVTHNRVRPCY